MKIGTRYSVRSIRLGAKGAGASDPSTCTLSTRTSLDPVPRRPSTYHLSTMATWLRGTKKARMSGMLGATNRGPSPSSTIPNRISQSWWSQPLTRSQRPLSRKRSPSGTAMPPVRAELPTGAPGP